MSLRSKKGPKEPERKGAAHARTVVLKPPGAVPSATVTARHAGSVISRSSKGFSFGEVEGSGMRVPTARDWGLPLDVRRRSVLDHNVEALKGWFSRAEKVEKPGEVKRIEKEIEKVAEEAEKEIKKGTAKVKKEAAKVEKGAKKVQEKVVKEVGAPAKALKGRKKAPKSKEKEK
jgi:ribosomal protein L13E